MAFWIFTMIHERFVPVLMALILFQNGGGGAPGAGAGYPQQQQYAQQYYGN